MSYTPINWKKGDLITAEKMNKMDNGWSLDTSVQTLFNGNATTVDEGGMNSGVFSAQVTAETITVTFNNTEYTVTRTEPFDGTYVYGDIGETGPDFTNYPFFIMYDYGDSAIESQLFTETSGTFALKIDGATSTLEISDNFATAVNSCVDTSMIPLLCVNGVTTANEMAIALYGQNRLLYFFDDTVIRLITSFTQSEINFIPTSSNVSAYFSNGVFYWTTT